MTSKVHSLRPPYTEEEQRKINLVKHLFKEAYKAMEKSLDKAMEKAEEELLKEKGST